LNLRPPGYEPRRARRNASDLVRQCGPDLRRRADGVRRRPTASARLPRIVATIRRPWARPGGCQIMQRPCATGRGCRLCTGFTRLFTADPRVRRRAPGVWVGGRCAADRMWVVWRIWRASPAAPASGQSWAWWRRCSMSSRPQTSSASSVVRRPRHASSLQTASARKEASGPYGAARRSRSRVPELMRRIPPSSVTVP
jgi:hypothetical protein